jgi:DNA-binding beta-propeller fold protein YncE
MTDFNFIKRVDEINGEEFRPITIFSNFDEKKFYICDNLNDRILITDLDFNFIKSVGSTGSGNCQFLSPYGICFSSSKFYICDYHNKRIQVYSKDFDFVTSFKVDYNPWKIKSTNFIICVAAASPSGIYFYNSNDFHLIRNYNHFDFLGRISQINSMFYEFNHKTQTVSCYDENANLKEETTLKGLDQFLTDTWDGAFIFHNGALLIQSHTEKKL